MPGLILDTRSVAATIRDQLKNEVAEFKQQFSYVPTLVIVCVGDDNAIYDYIRVVTRQAHMTGLRAIAHILPTDIRHEELVSHIEELNRNPAIQAISLQAPLPPHLNLIRIAEVIHPDKDAEGLHPRNAGDVSLNGSRLVAPPALGAMKLLSLYSINPAGRYAVVVGRNPIIGKPLAALLTEANATVTICHRQTPHLSAFTRIADLLVVAAQSPHLINGEMVKPGAIVLDFGINYVRGGSSQGQQIQGDVEFDSIKRVAGGVTPMPGGTGPMTVISLLQNVLKAARLQQN
ncbi:MAG TPA: bifunctional 5,10-methylenetetrahydrofolate dehydrogenase/5,10-methenyltetrahydrofolate cyclohydrolase [Chloroflexia bacterium]|nr:bifunctional 5,10-methylenetetrahydrofolate dehydrogenase/5,10-methenyltetrahydrofolate cyclohydrolase [Chloroflexia bacterium]